MISWIQRTFQHHFRIVFMIVLAIMVIPLVMIYRTGGGGNGSDRSLITRDFFGHNIGLAEENGRMLRDGQVSAQLQFGYAPDINDPRLERYAYTRVAAQYLADSLHLPEATSGEITAYIKSLSLFADQNGQFDANRYQSFRASLNGPGNSDRGDEIARVLADDVRADNARRLLGGPGYILDSDVRTQLLLSDTSWTIAEATIDYGSYHPAIKPTDSDLQRFFTTNAFRYEIPPQILADCAEFNAADYSQGVTVTEADARAAFEADPSRFAPPAPAATGKTAPPAPKNDFATARPRVEDALRQERARSLALKAAADFVYALYDSKIPLGSGLDAFLSSHSVKLKPLAPFSADAGPAELGGAPEIAENVAKLDRDRYYSDPLSTPKGAAVLIWRDSQAARQPSFAEVRAKVLSDYIENERRQKFIELGRTLKGAIEVRMKSGDSFAKAAVVVGNGLGVKVAVKTPAAFTFQTRPADLDNTAAGLLMHLDKGQVSDMATNADSGFIVCALDKKAPAIGDSNPRFAQVRGQLAAYASRTDAEAVIEDLVAQELKRSEPAVH